MKAVGVGENIRRRGTDVRAGSRVLSAGQRLRPQDLGLLAMLGKVRVRLFRQPRVALFSCGNELVLPGKAVSGGKIWDTNSVTLSALIRDAASEVLWLGIAHDSERAIKGLFERGVAHRVDLIVSSAGVSVGAFDLIRQVVESDGHLDFWRVNVRPGKPLAVGHYRGVPFIGLPGNPVSAFVGFELFVRPALARLAGIKSLARRGAKATLEHSLQSDGRESYLRAIVEEREGTLRVQLTGHQGSGNLFSLVQANALLLVPAGVKSLAVGDQADVWML
jgi:molybdopterin molybdotransferase